MFRLNSRLRTRYVAFVSAVLSLSMACGGQDSGPTMISETTQEPGLESSTSLLAIGSPQLVSFRPRRAQRGDTVTLSGFRFDDVETLELGIPDDPLALPVGEGFSIIDSRTIEFVVPDGASTGQIQITDQDGNSDISVLPLKIEPSSPAGEFDIIFEDASLKEVEGFIRGGASNDANGNGLLEIGLIGDYSGLKIPRILLGRNLIDVVISGDPQGTGTSVATFGPGANLVPPLTLQARDYDLTLSDIDLDNQRSTAQVETCIDANIPSGLLTLVNVDCSVADTVLGSDERKSAGVLFGKGSLLLQNSSFQIQGSNQSTIVSFDQARSSPNIGLINSNIQLVTPGGTEGGFGSAFFFVTPGVTTLSITAFEGNAFTGTGTSFVIRDDQGTGLSQDTLDLLLAISGNDFGQIPSSINNLTGSVYIGIQAAIDAFPEDGFFPDPIVIVGEGSFLDEDTIRGLTTSRTSTGFNDGRGKLFLDVEGLTISSINGNSAISGANILADNVTLGGDPSVQQDGGFDIVGTGLGPNVGFAVPYQVAVGDCDDTNTTVNNTLINANTFTVNSGDEAFVSIQICDLSASTQIRDNLLAGYTIAGVHIVSASPNSTSIGENQFSEAVGLGDPLPAAIVDRQTQPNGANLPFGLGNNSRGAIFGNTFFEDPATSQIIYLRDGGQDNLIESEPFEFPPLNGVGVEIQGEGAILQSFFNNQIEPTPNGVTVCGRFELVGWADFLGPQIFLLPGDPAFGTSNPIRLVFTNFWDGSDDANGTVSPFETNIQAFTDQFDPLCEILGTGDGVGLQFN